MTEKARSPKERKIVLRLRPSRLDEARVLQAYDERSEYLGNADHDYIRRLILIGYMIESAFGTGMFGQSRENIAGSTNESNNTRTDDIVPSQANVSSYDVASLVRVNDQAPPKEVVGTAIRQLAGVFGGNFKAS